MSCARYVRNGFNGSLCPFALCLSNQLDGRRISNTHVAAFCVCYRVRLLPIGSPVSKIPSFEDVSVPVKDMINDFAAVTGSAPVFPTDWAKTWRSLRAEQLMREENYAEDIANVLLGGDDDSIGTVNDLKRTGSGLDPQKLKSVTADLQRTLTVRVLSKATASSKMDTFMEVFSCVQKKLQADGGSNSGLHDGGCVWFSDDLRKVPRVDIAYAAAAAAVSSAAACFFPTRVGDDLASCVGTKFTWRNLNRSGAYAVPVWAMLSFPVHPVRPSLS